MTGHAAAAQHATAMSSSQARARDALFAVLAIAAMTVLRGPNVVATPFLRLSHLVLCLILLLCATAQVTDLRAAVRSRRAWLGVGCCLSYVAYLGVAEDPSPLFFVFVYGVGTLAFGSRSTPPFRWAIVQSSAVLYCALALADQSVLWTASVSDAIAPYWGDGDVAPASDVSRVGVSYRGIWIALGVGIPLAHGIIVRSASRAQRIGSGVALLALFWTLHRVPPTNDVLIPWITALGLLTAALLVPGNEQREVSGGVLHRVSAVGTATLLASIALIAFSPPTGQPDGRITLVRGAYNTWTPTEEDRTPQTGAMVGYFRMLLERIPIETSIVDRVEDLPLDTSVAVLVNYFGSLNGQGVADAATLERLEQFVENGGTLLVFGDHTDISGNMRAINPLLTKYGIEFIFDSAMPRTEGGWNGALAFASHPMFNIVETTDEFRVSVGATLQVGPPARRLIVGRAGFSDWGDRSAPNRAFLGDWSLGPGERLGDVALAASAPSSSGRGRIIVIGDTSMLQELSLSASWRFVTSLLTWSATAPASGSQRVPAGVALLVIGAIVVVIGGARSSLLTVTLVLLIPLASISIASFVAHRSQGALLRPVGVAWLRGHRGFGSPTYGSGPASLEEFGHALAFADFLPLVDRDGDVGTYDHGDAVVVLPGSGPMTVDEANDLLQFVERGGTLLVIGGHEDQESLSPLLDQLRVEIADVPLGRCVGVRFPSGPKGGQFRQAWAILGEQPAHADVIATMDQFPVAMRWRRGAGVVALIADADFPTDRCFERDEQPVWEVFEFLRDTLTGADL